MGNLASAQRGIFGMIKKSLIFAFGLVYSLVAFADFSGQTITVDYVLATEPAEDPLTVVAQPGTTPTSLLVPGNADFNFDGNVNCNIAITATQITIGSCDFASFGSAGGVTFNGFRFTQNAAAPDITGATPSGSVTAVIENADSIAVNLITQDLQTGTAVLDVTFAAPVVNTSPVPVLAPLGLWLLGLLIAGVSYRAHGRR